MFPFTLDGPSFLVFYLVLTVGVALALRQALRRGGPQHGGDALQRLAADPYALACLRRDPSEAVRVAVVSLVDRGALATTDDGEVAITDDGRRWPGALPLERAVLQACRAGPQPPDLLLRDDGVQRTAQAIEADLQQRGLLISPALRQRRTGLTLGAAALLLAVSAARVVQTLMAGRSNLGFLLVLTGVAMVVVWVMAQGRATSAGLTALTHQQSLLKDLRQRVGSLQPGRSNRDVAMLAAAFGLAVLPAAAFAFAGELFPERSSGGSSGGSDSGSSSDGSDGGGGGDSGCGGGGCGGGSSD